MSEHNKHKPRSGSSAPVINVEATEDLRPREERLHKVNELLSHLSTDQRRSLTQKLTRDAPELVTSGARGKPIDTPMRRARSIARTLLKQERKAAAIRGARAHSSPHDPVDSSPESASRDSIDDHPPPPLRALLKLTPAKLLRAYRAAELSEWLKALKIAEPEIQEHLIFNLPPRESSELEAALRELGPVKLGEAQRAEEAIRASVKRELS